MSEKIVRARVRVLWEYTSRSIDPPGVRHFHKGEETEMFHVTPDSWWDSLDVDGAHIIPASHIEIVGGTSNE